jgi:hypothetical protein
MFVLSSQPKTLAAFPNLPWVISAILTLCQPLPAYPEERTSPEQSGFGPFRAKSGRTDILKRPDLDQCAVTITKLSS